MGMPSNYQIFNYWKDKKLEDGEEIQFDWGEPECWGCGHMFTVETQRDLDKCDFKGIWNRTSGLLERCHIHPKALGGTDTPDNLFLLCPKCHKASPDTTDREYFFKWVVQKRKERDLYSVFFGYDKEDVSRAMRDIDNTFKEFGLTYEIAVEYLKLHNLEWKDVADSAYENEEESINTHSFKFSISSSMYPIAKEFKRRIDLENAKEVI